jgi:EH domain-containing protein 1
LSEDIPKLMRQIPLDDSIHYEDLVTGGTFDTVGEGDFSPFGYGRGEGADAGRGEPTWIVAHERDKHDLVFQHLSPINGKVGGLQAKKEMVKSKLPNSVLGKVWKLADIDQDGQLDIDEFALAMHLIQVKMDGHDLPNELPRHLIPPSKRGAPLADQEF